MQKAEIIRAYKNNQTIYAKDGQGNSTVSASPAPEQTSILREAYRVELLSDTQVDSVIDFFLTKWENDWEPTMSDLQAVHSSHPTQSTYHYSPNSKPRWAVKARSLITNQVHVGWVSSKHLLEVVTPQVNQLLKDKLKVYLKAKQDAEIEANLREANEEERKRQEHLVTAQLVEQFTELTGKAWDTSDFSAYGVNTKLEYFDRTQTDGTVVRDAKVKTEGDVRVSYDAWMVLMTKLQQLYDSMDD